MHDAYKWMDRVIVEELSPEQIEELLKVCTDEHKRIINDLERTRNQFEMLNRSINAATYNKVIAAHLKIIKDIQFRIQAINGLTEALEAEKVRRMLSK